VPTSEQIDAAALILRRLRGCDAPLQSDGSLPCPFCLWGWGGENGNDETGCMFAAEEMLKAAEAAK